MVARQSTEGARARAARRRGIALRYRFATVRPDDRVTSSLSGKERLCLALASLALCLALSFQLASRPLFEPDEGRNGEVMREMSVSGDSLVPRLNGLLFLDKPFLYFAAGAVGMTVLGVHELAARLPGVLSTLALGLVIGLLARRWWGGRAGLLAGFAAVAAPLPLLYSQIVIFDAMLTLWICSALVAFSLAVESAARQEKGGDASSPYWSALAWGAIGLGILTKGPVALLVPLAAVVPWAIWRRRAGSLVAKGAPLVGLALVVPWLWVVGRADPSFLRYALVTETWSRLTSNELQRDAPFWFYLPVVLLGALPWSVIPLAGLRRLATAWRARQPEVRFLILWFCVPYVLFSLMHSKRVHYILPLVPALILLSVWLWRETPRGARLPGVRAAAALWSLLGLVLLALGLGAAPQLLARVDGVASPAASRVAVTLGVAWFLAGAAAFFSSRSTLRAFCALSLPPLAFLLLTAPLAAAVGARRSARDLARSIDRDYRAGIEVVAVEAFPASLPFYLERPLTMTSADGHHLRSNYISRRYAQMVGDAGPLRSPAWLAGAARDCATPRVFVVRRHNAGARGLLAAAGRPLLEGGRDFVVYGPCAGASTGVSE